MKKHSKIQLITSMQASISMKLLLSLCLMLFASVVQAHAADSESVSDNVVILDSSALSGDVAYENAVGDSDGDGDFLQFNPPLNAFGHASCGSGHHHPDDSRHWSFFLARAPPLNS